MDSSGALLPSVPTGDPRVDEAIAGLASLADTDLPDRPAVLEEVHDKLREILGELDGQGELSDARQPGPAQPGSAQPGQERP
jgi:hypothetical protein